MYLENEELQLLQKLGFGISNGRIVKAEEDKLRDLKYAGFGIYVSGDSSSFEKQGEELIEIITPEKEAEKRFMRKNLT